MRVTVVSAHYPPNFVSGGTLQPQRIAHGLRDLGHDVRVFAGWLGNRRPLDTWDEPDPTGMPVTWIASGEWIGWENERNWYNLGVAQAFRQYLAEFTPDIVHFHSLQSLGAALLPAAKSTGARVVVTMHDFWWLCTRQFLVDPDYNPCCLVQNAGACPCQCGEPQRNHRSSTLATLLGSADLVLAPSAKAAEVLAANGVAPGRLEVDENGLPAAVASKLSVRRNRKIAGATGTPLRFLYAGGPDPMKGVQILLNAAEHLASVPGWRLSAYGVAPFIAESGIRVATDSINVLDPYEPDDLESILEEHDVLVLPSIARETHSLLTREALASGVPVICTDTPGPTEVIRSRTNGLVVPTGDIEALAGAMRSLVDDANLLDQITSGACEPISAPSIDDQVAGLEKRFESLAADHGGSKSGSAVRSVLFVCGIEGAPLRYRARLPAEALALLGVHSEVRHYRDPELLTLGRSADIVVFYRVPATIQILEVISALRCAGIPTVFDVDDLIFDPDIRGEVPALERLSQRDADLWLQGVQRYRTTLESCDAYIGSTNFLVEHATDLTGLPAYRFANGVGQVVSRRSDIETRRPRKSGPTRIGYMSGTTTHDDDWFFIEPAVISVLDKHPDVELWMGGHLPESRELSRFGSRVKILPFMDWRELPGCLRDLDINLAPLSPGSRFNEAKSAIKWLEAALCGTPTVASPTEPFTEAIENGTTGILAGSVDEWTHAIESLLDDKGARSRIGGLARDSALMRWSPALQATRYLAILDDVINTGSLERPPGDSGWKPVTLDEPPIDGITLEHYGDDESAAGIQISNTSAITDSVDMRVSIREQKMIISKRTAVERARETLVKIRSLVKGE